MSKYCGSIYKKAREEAALTQEQASILIPIPVRTLSSYENGRLLPSSDTVCKMVEVYECNWLWYMHLKKNDSIGTKFLPDINLGRLSANVLRLQKEMSDVYKEQDSLINVACDDEISAHERNDWMKACEQIEELMGACVALMITNKKTSLDGHLEEVTY